MDRLRRRALLGLALAVACAAAAAAGLRATRLDPAALWPPPSVRVVDRDGRLLRWLPDARGERHRWVGLDAVSPAVVAAFVAAEDRRFPRHHGVDGWAVARAAWQDLRARRVVSGASTLTQQLVRLAMPHRRGWLAKAVEAGRALRLERRLEKREILTLYLNRVPMGRGLVGVEAAAECYLGKPAARLDAAEAALLAALPKAPGRLSQPRAAARLEARRRWVVRRMVAAGYLTQAEGRRARAARVRLDYRPPPFEAPHAVELALRRCRKGCEEVRTTLELPLQHRVEAAVAAHRSRLARFRLGQAAVVVLDNRDASVRALVGSLAYGPEAGGYNDGATARHAAGSTLKPFLAALALDRGLTEATLLPDVARRYPAPSGPWRPADFDHTTEGAVSLRDALATSRNLPWIDLLSRLGPEPFDALLSRLGLAAGGAEEARRYGLGLAVGALEVRPLDLAAAYAALARGGRYRPPHLLAGAAGEGVRLFSPQAAYIVCRILADGAARLPAFGPAAVAALPPHAAVKTGTSNGGRDVWAVGVTRRYTVVVWAGNFRPRRTPRASGGSAALPLLADLLRLLGPGVGEAPFPRPPGVVAVPVCGVSGMRPGPHCPEVRTALMVAGTEPTEVCTYHRRGPLWHDLPPRYAAWLAERHRRGAAGRYRLAGFTHDLDRLFGGGPPPTGAAPVAAAPRIVEPLEGERRLLADTPVLPLRAECEAALPWVAWYVDGVEVGRVGPPYELRWRPTRGRHEILAAGPAGLADRVTVRVE